MIAAGSQVLRLVLIAIGISAILIFCQDWVHESSRDATNKPRTSRSTSLRVKALTTVEGVEQGVNVELQYVTVPPGDEAKLLSHPICPICKETLQVEFLEEEEEWIWRNAIKKDDKVNSCFYSQLHDSYLLCRFITLPVIEKLLHQQVT